MSTKDVITCPKCKGKGKQGDYTTLLFPPVFFLGRFIDWIDGDTPGKNITYDVCHRCNGEGWIMLTGKSIND